MLRGSAGAGSDSARPLGALIIEGHVTRRSRVTVVTLACRKSPDRRLGPLQPCKLTPPRVGHGRGRGSGAEIAGGSVNTVGLVTRRSRGTGRHPGLPANRRIADSDHSSQASSRYRGARGSQRGRGRCAVTAEGTGLATGQRLLVRAAVPFMMGGQRANSPLVLGLEAGANGPTAVPGPRAVAVSQAAGGATDGPAAKTTRRPGPGRRLHWAGC
jgi:hypothetical protein